MNAENIRPRFKKSCDAILNSMHTNGVPSSVSLAPIAIKLIREKNKMSQSEFSSFIGVPLSTFQKWEQGTRVPDEAAISLLLVADREPKALKKALSVRASNRKSLMT
jgi:DNA-binding transcriptional regulator YiaG